MKPRTALLLAVATSLVIRLVLLSGAPGLGAEGYETLVQVQSIAENGLPETQTAAWGGGRIAHMPVFYYLIAFFTLILPETLAALLIPNLLISLLPVPIYLLATQATRNRRAQSVAVLLSPFPPLLLGETLLDANPLTLALPLLLLTYYYFIRLGHTPKDQIPFLVSLIAVTLTHPISLLLVPGMALSILLIRIQRTRFSYAMAEATLFTTVLTIWATLLFHKQLLLEHGIRTFWTGGTLASTGVSGLAAIIGIIPLFGGTYAAFSYLRAEKSGSIHAIVAAALTALILGLLGILETSTAALLLSILLTVLVAPAWELLQESKTRSKAPWLYSLGGIVLTLLFIATSVLPAIAAGAASYAQAPDEQDLEIVRRITEYQPHSTVLWGPEHGALLEYAGLRPVMSTEERASTSSSEVQQELARLPQIRTEVGVVGLLNRYEVDIIVLDKNHTLPISERCFPTIHENGQEVHAVRCVVQ